MSSKATDVFLSHNWGNDELERDNHARVGVINKALQERGYNTWFDADAMHGSVPDRMAEGIDNTNLVVVFVTAKYREKVNTGKASDNCRLEFKHALNVKTADKVVCVLMDYSMADPTKWGGILGMYCGSNLYVNMVGDLDDKEYLDGQLDMLVTELEGMGLPRPQVAAAPTPAQAPTAEPISVSGADAVRTPIAYSADYYFIVSELNGLMLDIAGGVQGGKLQTFPHKQDDNCDSQLWQLDEEGFLNSKTGLVADIAGDNKSPGASVVAWSKKTQGNANQQWEIRNGRIRSKLNNLLIDIPGANPAPSTPINMWTEKEKDQLNQLWKIVLEDEMVQRDYFFIVSEMHGLVLEIHGGAQGGRIQTFNHKKGQNCDNQLWYLDKEGFLKSKTGLVADIQGENQERGAKVIAWSKKSQGNTNQLWEMQYGRIRSKLNSMVMDIPGENRDPSTGIIMWPEKRSGNATNQLWKMVPEKEMVDFVAPNYFFIVSELNGLVLDINGGAVRGGKIQTFNHKKGQNCDNQLWYIEDGFLKSKTGLVADIAGENRAPGAGVIAWSRKSQGNANQQWKIKDGRITSEFNGLVMDIPGENKAPCTAIIMYHRKTAGNLSNQMWKLVPENEMESKPSGKKLSEILQGATSMNLQGYHNKWYFSAQPNGAAECKSQKVGACETISVEISTDGEHYVYLKSSHGKFLSARPDGTLQWDRDNKGDGERFEAVHISRNKIALKSSHGKWVSAQPDGSIQVNRDNLNAWEEFTVYPALYSFPGNTVALQGKYNNWYVSAQPNGEVECKSKSVDKCERIGIEKEGDRHIYLKSHHGKYLSAQPNGKLEWNRTENNNWERFQAVQVGNNRIGLKSFHGKWVSAQADGKIEVNHENLGASESFSVISC